MGTYIYRADIYCKECGEAIQAKLSKEGKAPSFPHLESTFDSDEYPKGPYPDGGGEADTPHHCGNAHRCLNPLELSDGQKVGRWLGNPLTKAGVEYVREAQFEGGEVAELWAKWYEEELRNPLEVYPNRDYDAHAMGIFHDYQGCEHDGEVA